MADEFIKGLGIISTAGLCWMILAGWYNTPTFEALQYPQLLAPAPVTIDRFGEVALILKDSLFWLAVLGTVTFWIVIPAVASLQAE